MPGKRLVDTRCSLCVGKGTQQRTEAGYLRGAGSQPIVDGPNDWYGLYRRTEETSNKSLREFAISGRAKSGVVPADLSGARSIKIVVAGSLS